jgi:hypothetical protein
MPKLKEYWMTASQYLLLRKIEEEINLAVTGALCRGNVNILIQFNNYFIPSDKSSFWTTQ